jgi:asparagine synthase (glutamine-hydrolysing)
MGDVIADLAFARLAIVDLSDAGQQPMSNEDGRFTMVFNGEIYNSPTLRRECERAGRRFLSSMDVRSFSICGKRRGLLPSIVSTASLP